MITIEHTDDKGRKYKAYQEGELDPLIVGPPEGLMDEMGLPEPFATDLHNILYRRGLLTYRDVQRKPKELQGALQEAMRLDVQKLAEGFFSFEKEIDHEE